MGQIVTFFYSLCILCLYGIAWILKPFNKKLAYQFIGREHPSKFAPDFAKKRARADRGIVFFCSSAGEYEQAKPIIDRVKKVGNPFIVIIFHSRSGYEFAQARGESCDYCLAPPDTIWHWGWLLSSIRPDSIFVVRYELWLGFLEIARRYGTLYLVDGNSSDADEPPPPLKWIRRLLLSYFSHIFVVSEDDERYFSEHYGLKKSKMSVVGDTKYDRVLERVRQSNESNCVSLIQKLRTDRQVLVLGSAYLPDIELFIEARAADPELAKGWFPIVVTHDISEPMITSVNTALKKAGLSPSTLSKIDEGRPCDALIVDQMGILAEIYSCGDLAWVGGALHNRVHNVLEPASKGLALGFGPNYTTSHEARQLLSMGLAESHSNSTGFLEWWKGHAHHDKNSKLQIIEAVQSLRGASDKIVEAVTP
jgi:3-deoxy-D-manno-octulosonic-acid transferase